MKNIQMLSNYTGLKKSLSIVVAFAVDYDSSMILVEFEHLPLDAKSENYMYY